MKKRGGKEKRRLRNIENEGGRGWAREDEGKEGVEEGGKEEGGRERERERESEERCQKFIEVQISSSALLFLQTTSCT